MLSSRKAARPPDWLPEAEVFQIRWNDSSTLKNMCTKIDLVIYAACMNAQDCSNFAVAVLKTNGMNKARMDAEACRPSVPRFFLVAC